MFSIDDDIGFLGWHIADYGCFLVHKGCLDYAYLEGYWCIRGIWHKGSLGYEFFNMVIAVVMESCVVGTRIQKK